MKMSNRQSSIRPKSFTTTLSATSDKSQADIVMSHAPLDNETQTISVSPLAYHIVAAKVAYLMHSYAAANAQISIARICKLLQELNILEKGLPPHLSGQMESVLVEHLLPGWVHLQRRQTGTLIQICRINLCLSFLPQIIETGEDKFDIRGHGILASRAILQSRRNDTSPYFGKLWGTRCCTLAAGIYVALDLICFIPLKTSAEAKEHIQMIELSIEMLQDCHRVSQEGSALLGRLIQLYQIWPPRQAMDKQTIHKIMKYAADPSTFFSSSLIPTDLDRTPRMNTLWNHDDKSEVPNTLLATEVDDLEGYNFEDLITASAATPIDIDGMIFDAGSDLLEAGSYWIDNSLIGFFPGAPAI
jgi:hypothetical protein